MNTNKRQNDSKNSASYRKRKRLQLENLEKRIERIRQENISLRLSIAIKQIIIAELENERDNKKAALDYNLRQRQTKEWFRAWNY